MILKIKLIPEIELCKVIFLSEDYGKKRLLYNVLIFILNVALNSSVGLG